MIIVITVKRFNFSQLTNSHCWLFILCFLMLFFKFVYQNLHPPFLVNWPIFSQFHGIWFSHVSYCFCCFVSFFLNCHRKLISWIFEFWIYCTKKEVKKEKIGNLKLGEQNIILKFNVWEAFFQHFFLFFLGKKHFITLFHIFFIYKNANLKFLKQILENVT